MAPDARVSAVDAAGTVTSVVTGTGVDHVVMIDQALPADQAVAALRGLESGNGRLLLALTPEGGGAPRPVDAAVDAWMGGFCADPDAVARERKAVVARCPQAEHPFGVELPCSSFAAALEPALAACPKDRVPLVALFGCSQAGVGPGGDRVLVPVGDLDKVAALTGLFGEAWPAIASAPERKVRAAGTLDVKRRVDPRYPKAARALGLGEQRCLVQVIISEKGLPTAVEVEKCPEVFHKETRAAIMKWAWYPPKVDGSPVRAKTTIAVTYVLE